MRRNANFGRYLIIKNLLITSILLISSYAQSPSNFYAYYTRVDYSEYSKQISGDYADVIVNIGDKGKLIFSREYSFRPIWKYDGGETLIKHLAKIEGDGPQKRNFDKLCRYSYVRLIESNDKQVLVHWRYFPNLSDLDPTSVVHELYTINKNGNVIREYKKGSATIDAWLDENNKTTQTFTLTSNGISNINTVKGSFTASNTPIKGNPVSKNIVGSPAAWWKFDEGVGNSTKESVSSAEHNIYGHKSLWKKGVSGTALGFDGYFSKVELPQNEAPEIGSSFTIDTWVTIGVYPFALAPIVHQSSGELDDLIGYILGINEFGKIEFKAGKNVVKTKDPLPRNKWVHLAATYGNGSIKIYVNGDEKAAKSLSGKLNIPDVPLLIGLYNRDYEASLPVREEHNYPFRFGIEGLIDEVKIYTRALSASDVQSSYNNFNPGPSVVNNPDIELRTLPGQPGVAAKFGATYERLKFHDLWDNMWRVDKYSDVIVKFDDKPTSYIWWRGTTHGVNMVTENNFWMADQSVEIFCEKGIPHGNPSLSEHMSDKEARYSHVRVLENTPARVIVHWRYAVADLFYYQCDSTGFVDEYHIVYPDGTLLRNVVYWTEIDNAGIVYTDLQALTPQGYLPTDVVNSQSLSGANSNTGAKEDLTWSGSSNVPGFSDERRPDILMANFKSDWKIYQAFIEGEGGPWGAYEQSSHSDNAFAGPWNHWPVARAISDGTYSVDGSGRTNSFALSAGEASSVLYGFHSEGNKTAQNVKAVIPVVKAWKNSPKVTSLKGATSSGYNANHREYNFTLINTLLTFTLEASSKNPLLNPCFVIKPWNGGNEAIVKINSKKNKDVKHGIIRDTDGSETMIIYLPYNSTSRANIEISGVD